MNHAQRESLTTRVRPVEYQVVNAYTGEVLLRTRSLEPAEDFYEAETERNTEDCIQLVAVIRETGGGT